MNRQRLLWFAGVIAFQFLFVFYIAWSWNNVRLDGVRYEWLCRPYLQSSIVGPYRLFLEFPENEAQWIDTVSPKVGDTIYIQISKDPKGMLTIRGASKEEPGAGDYMQGEVVEVADRVVKFKVPFTQVLVNTADVHLEKIKEQDKVTASIRMKDGKGVVDGVFVNGIAITEYQGSVAKEEKAGPKKGNAI